VSQTTLQCSHEITALSSIQLSTLRKL
jgi:hypothetical protein